MATNQNMKTWQLASLGGAGAGAAYGMLNNENPADKAMDYFDKIPGTITPYYQSFIDAGQRTMPKSESQYDSLVNNPGGTLNDIGKNYQQSPGFQFALQQALQGSNHAMAAGGMSGSPMHEQHNMELGTNLANQDFNTWMKNALGLHGLGTEGREKTMDRGYNSSNELAQSIANILMSQGTLSMQGQSQQNQNQGDMISSLASMAALAAFS